MSMTDPSEKYDLPVQRENIDELSDEVKEFIDEREMSVKESFEFAARLVAGKVPEPGTRISNTYSGETKAEALGHSYHNRDEIRENGAECRAEYVRPLYVMDGLTFHQVDIIVGEDE